MKYITFRHDTVEVENELDKSMKDIKTMMKILCSLK